MATRVFSSFGSVPGRAAAESHGKSEFIFPRNGHLEIFLVRSLSRSRAHFKIRIFSLRILANFGYQSFNICFANIVSVDHLFNRKTAFFSEQKF